VRSSATAEDLPDASFAGQQETFLNVTGVDDVVIKVKEVFASLYNDRAIAYRVHHGFKHEDVFLSAGVQLMVRSDLGASGVLFTMDTESGFREVVFITSSYGLGEMVVQGAVNPGAFEATAVLQRLEECNRYPLVVFDRPLALNGNASAFPLVSNVFATRERCAISRRRRLSLRARSTARSKSSAPSGLVR